MRLPLALFCLAASPLAAQTYPFEGTWDCEASVFTFTTDTYLPGEGGDLLEIDSILDSRDGSFAITMPDGYTVYVSMNNDGTMSWLSGESGDSFSCTALN